MARQVLLRNGCIEINGKPEILLCSSFFYFRIPREYWRPRMRQLKTAGYNAIDVYFPWNYHELRPGVWEFSGEHDVAAFLQMASEEELYVVARPGPYICSEWDGGGIPIWVHQKTENVRQFDPTYLQMFAEWMKQILPIIHEYQQGTKGSVVLMQLENELDLFPCRHAHRYMEAIRNIADSFHFEIPYVACVAGKGDLDAATGMVDRVYPSFNIYPPFSDPSVEEKMLILQKQILMPKGLPLLATETEREHHFLRRELASGVRLISPYCQMASTNFDCRNGVSGWGGTPEKRTVYIANDYDMNSMLKSDGAVTKEYLEARLLANMIRTMGDAVGGGVPFEEERANIEVNTSFQTNDEGVHAMALRGGGWMLCLPNLSRESGAAEVKYNNEIFHLRVEGDRTRLLLLDVPMERWGYPSASILWSALDVVWIGNDEMALCGEGDGLCLLINGEKKLLHGGEKLTLDGRSLSIRLLDWEEAARSVSPYLPAFTIPTLPEWQSEKANISAMGEDNEAKTTGSYPIRAMEDFGCYNGRMTYRFVAPECRYLLLKNTADIAALWVNGNWIRSWASDAAMQKVPVQGGRVTLKTEIWGHTCFDECYNPLLYMKSLRGLEEAFAVLEEKDIHNNWHFSPDEGPFGKTVTPLWSALPCITQCGNLVPKGYLFSGMYRREIRMPVRGNARLLFFDGITMRAAVYVNGCFVAEVDRKDPYIDITAYTAPATLAELIVRVRADQAEASPGTLYLLTAEKIEKTEIGYYSVDELRQGCSQMQGAETTLPMELHGGESKWLQLEVEPHEGKERWLRPVGKDVMVTIISHGHVLGRLFPGCQLNMLMRAGDEHRVWLPGEWLKKEKTIHLRIEALHDVGILESIQIDER